MFGIGLFYKWPDERNVFNQFKMVSCAVIIIDTTEIYHPKSRTRGRFVYGTVLSVVG